MTTDSTPSIRDELQEIAAPLQSKLETLNERISEVQTELDELRRARQDIEAILNRLNGVRPGVKKPESKSPYEERKEVTSEQLIVIRDFILSKRDQLADGFTATQIKRLADGEQLKPVMATDRYRGAVEQLHANGVLRLDKKVRGGASLYKVVGRG